MTETDVGVGERKHPARSHLPGGRSSLRAAAFLLSALLVAVSAGSWSALSGSGRAEATVPGQPGVTQAPTVLSNEDFENGMGNSAVILTGYTGAAGQTYTADPAWLTGCNGYLFDFAAVGNATNGSAANGSCSVARFHQAQQASYALGAFAGGSTTGNHALVEYTEASASSTATVLQSVAPTAVPNSAAGRFLVFGLDISAIFACSAPLPSYRFSAVNGATVTPVTGSLTACSAGGTSEAVPANNGAAATNLTVNRLTTSGSILYTSPTVGFRINNTSSGTNGNDAAIDNIRVLDATPQLDKSFSPTSVAVGATSTLTFTITNTTDLASKNGWSFTDALPTGLVIAPTPAASTTCASGTTVSAVAGGTSVSVPSGNLAAGAASCTVKVNVTSATANTYVNDAGNMTGLGGLNPPGSSSVRFGTPAVDLSVAKTADPTGYVAGSPLTFTVVVGNAGPTNAIGATVSDPLPAPLAGAGFTWTCAASTGSSCTSSGTGNVADTVTVLTGGTLTYTVTGTVPAGTVAPLANTATVTPPSGTADAGCTPSCSATVTVPVVPPNPALSVTKSASPSSVTAAGAVVTFTITATNTGNVTLTGVTVTDALPGLSALQIGPWPSGTPGTLNAGEKVVATGTYTVTQADIDSGSIANTATASGTPATGPPVTDSTTVTVAAAPAPDLALVKTGALAAGATGSAGDAVTYSFTATNTGNVTLSDVAISDPLPGLSALEFTWPGTPGTLAPGQAATATATGHLTQADVDAGSVTNTATASGTPPTGTAVTADSSATVPVTPAPALTVTKVSSVGTVTTVGQALTYTVTATNTGNVTLTDVAIADPLPGLSPLVITWPGPDGVLAPGQTATATGTYAVTQADLDAGTIRNTATARGTTPTGTTTTGSAGATVTAARSPDITLSKSGSLAPGTPIVAGDTVTYSFTATNTGNVTIDGISIADPLPGLSALTYVWPGAAGSLAPGQIVTATATHQLTQAEVDGGGVTNTATVTGTAPDGSNPSASASTTVPVVPAPALVLSKSATPSSVTSAGQQITYTVGATNSGNVTLTGVGISDSLPGLSAFTYTWPGTAGTLAPGQSVSATATYTVTQADIDAGAIVNLASGTGTTPTRTRVDADAGATVPVAQSPALSLVKSGEIQGDGTVRLGNTVQYTFVAHNDGNVTLTGVTIDDPLPGLSALEYTWPGAAGVLEPGEQVTAIASYTFTQDDVDAGRLDNTATASGTPPAGAPVDATASTEVPGTPAPAIALTKNASRAPGTAHAGDVIAYRLVATNTGNVTLTGVTIEDPLPGLSALTYVWPSAVGVLAPGQSVTATATYLLTQADIDAGTRANSATASATAPSGASVSDSAEAAVPLTPQPGLAVAKAATPTSISATGQTITYSVTVTNTGNVTLSGVTIADPMAGLSAFTVDWPGTPGTLAPGEVATGTATYTPVQSDIDAGAIVNVATATGSTPGGGTTTGTGAATVTVDQTGGLAVTKTAAPASVSAAGDVITYTIVATNTGNVTLTGVSITDPHPGLSSLTYDWPGAQGTLLPGQAVTATAPYAVTQPDIDSGSIANTATATGTTPDGSTTTGSGSVDVPASPHPAVTVQKTAVPTTIATAGDTVAYTIVSTNTGNVTLTGVVIADPLPGLSTISTEWPGPTGTLAPGQSATSTATYTATQSDIDTGAIANTATATGTTPDGGTISGTGTSTVTAPAAPALTTVKTASPTRVTAAGQVVDFTISTTNTGNVTLSDVTVTDALPGLGTLQPTWPGTAGSLAPGQQVVATAAYTVTQSDIDAGSIVNTATTGGTPPVGPPVDSGDTTTVAVDQQPGLTVVKSSDPTTVDAVGQTITYTIVTANTGNVTLSGVGVTDPMLPALTFDWPGTPGTLQPG